MQLPGPQLVVRHSSISIEDNWNSCQTVNKLKYKWDVTNKPVHGLDHEVGKDGIEGVYPSRQEQMYDPTVLVQLEFAPHIPSVVWHSSMSDKIYNNARFKARRSPIISSTVTKGRPDATLPILFVYTFYES